MMTEACGLGLKWPDLKLSRSNPAACHGQWACMPGYAKALFFFSTGTPSIPAAALRALPLTFASMPYGHFLCICRPHARYILCICRLLTLV